MEDGLTLQEVLALAEAEGVKFGVRYGRITCRGGSPVLSREIVAHEKELVEYLGGQFRSPWLDILNEYSRAL